MNKLRKILEYIGISKKRESGKRDFEWESVQSVAKEQFLRLKEKGLSIPVMTL